MKIEETILRDCCSRKDLKPIEGTPKLGHDPQYVFCIHCGTHRKIHNTRDAAGGSDWEYLAIPKPWDKSAP